MHGALSLPTKALLDVLLVEEQIEHGDICQTNHCILDDASEQDWVSLILNHDEIILLQFVHLLHLLYPPLVRDLAVVLGAVLPAEEDHSVLPLVDDPALAGLHEGPLGTRVGLEVRVLRVGLVEDQLGVAQLARDDERLDR